MTNSHQNTSISQLPCARLPVIWCVGGVDSSGGAGITRDAITLADLNVHACVLTTQLTVQSNLQLLNKESVSASALNQQWQVLYEDTPPRAIKIGAIANDEQALLLCARIQSLIKPRPFVIWDPVLSSSSGGVLTDLSESVIDELLNTVDLVTPNIDELAWLSNLPVNDDTSLASAINRLIGKGAKSVYVKGGHAEWQAQAYDTFVCASHTLHFCQPKVNNGKLRGTGCMLASAIAAFIVHDYCIEDALTLANAYVCEVRRSTLCEPDTDSAKAHNHGDSLPTYFPRSNGFPSRAASFPKVNFHQGGTVFYNKDLCLENLSNSVPPSESEQGNIARFPTLTYTNLGIYPVVDSVEWIARLWPTGVKIIQLRVKEGSQQEIRQQIKDAIELVAHTNCQLFINDYWELAIELGAYGVHLGQEDLDAADLNAIRSAGLRLGISTHGFAEIQRVRALTPSYIALGHIFPTNTKDMPSKPQGIERLAKYVKLCEGIPTVAIGGINLSRIGDVAKTGVDGIAVVSAITRAEQPLKAYQALAQEAGFA
ncbi:thiamine phosphate synthase [Alteromonas sp. ALT199]|uniref:thiamine phosphate synthase n=1 Tax=unclassified Alteromonas TaxID=2614992 RepID=UPI00044F0CCA|nr:thiamine phosphate synthase [Alteromonas sp. ALT199]MBT3135168.1 thiamine phosphate synthase [Alteromonas sp. ALT199]